MQAAALFPVAVQRQLGVENPGAQAAGVGEHARKVFGLDVHPHVGDRFVAVNAADIAGDGVRFAAQIFVKVGQTGHLSDTQLDTTYN